MSIPVSSYRSLVMENYMIVLLALACAAALATIHQKRSHRHRRNLPPGPKPWPIIGNMHLLGSSPHKSLHSLSQKYGEIMQLKFGNTPVVIASSPHMAKQFLRLHDANFASRPALSDGKYTSDSSWAPLLWVPHGPDWRQARKIFLAEVFSAKRLDFFEPVRAYERRSFYSRLASLSGQPIVIRDHLSRHTLSIMSRIVLGGEYLERSGFNLEEFRRMLREWMMLHSFVNVRDWVPWLTYLHLHGNVKRMRELYKKFDRFHDYVIDDHLATKTRAKPKDEADILDMLLLAEDPTTPQAKLTRDCIKGLLQDLFAGGTDTAAALVEWAIHEVLRHPPVMKKAKEELHRVIGLDRWAEESDFPQLPFINAIIMETMRLHPLSPLLPPHSAIEDCQVAEYDVAKGTAVIINSYSLGRDPASWDSPDEFLPERFLGKEVDVMGNNFALLPFGSGRRSCPGYKLGVKIVGTTLSNLLHGFDLRLVEGMRAEEICLDEVYGLIQYPKHPLSIIMEPTLAPQLY